jgi:transcriptional regulator with XRE-family HTH domain
MNREELLKSKEYWIGEIQYDLFELIEDYLKKNNLSRIQFAEKLGVTKGYVSQILNGEFDHRISKFVELSLTIGKVPRINFFDIEKILESDKKDELHIMNIELKFSDNTGISQTVTSQTSSVSSLSDINSNYVEYKKLSNYETTKKEECELA